MRTWPLVLVAAVLAVSTVAAAAADTPKDSGKGGAGPCLASCLLGPRVGQEMNEGQRIELNDVLPLAAGVLRLWTAYDWGYQAAGGKGFLASCCIGPRVGKEFKERKIRTKEKLLLVPVVNLYPWVSMGLEAYSGKTMAQIEKEENLRR